MSKRWLKPGGFVLILSIDPSTKSGVVVLRSTKEETSLVRSHTIRADKFKGLDRFHFLYTSVFSIVEAYSPDLIIVEGFSFASRNCLSAYQTGTITRYALYGCRNVIEVAPTSLKKFVSGKGNIKKDRMMLEVYKRWAFEGTDDECDAYGLAMFGAAILGHVTLPDRNMEAVNKWLKEHPDFLDCRF